MRLARASENDLKMAEALLLILCDVFEDGLMPRDVNDQETEDRDVDSFNERDFDDLRILYTRIEDCFNMAPGGLRRVIWGMSTLMNSGIIDLKNDCLCVSVEGVKDFLKKNISECVDKKEK